MVRGRINREVMQKELRDTAAGRSYIFSDYLVFMQDFDQEIIISAFPGYVKIPDIIHIGLGKEFTRKFIRPYSVIPQSVAMFLPAFRFGYIRIEFYRFSDPEFRILAEN